MARTRAPSSVALIITVFLASAVTAGAASDPSGMPSADATAPYIVVLHESEDSISIAGHHAARHDVEPRHVYEHALQGYSAELTAEQVAALEADESVAYVDEDVVLHTQQQPVPTGVRRVFGPDNPHLGIGGPDDVRVDVDVAVIDTGVGNHVDLDVVDRVNCTGFSGSCSPGGNDDNGHGTHVAGSIGAVNNGSGVVGVAPGARIWSQKVCTGGGQCTQSAIVAGIDYVTANADQIEVANMSLGGPGTNQPIAQAISASVAAGVVYVVAAGNSNQDARGFQPANHPDVVTVSALADSDGLPGGTGGTPSCRPQSRDDHLADFSNWGPAVDIAAPGVCITSTWNNGGYQVISGTSMASPHAAGAAAILTSGGNGPTDRSGVLAVRDTLGQAGNFDWFWQSRGSGDVQEPLLDISDGDVFPPDPSGPGDPPDPPDPPDNEPPVASFTAQCFGFFLICVFDGSGSSDADGDVVAWQWDFGDGTTGSGASSWKFYTAPGTYTVTLTVTDDGGATGTTSRNVTL